MQLFLFTYSVLSTIGFFKNFVSAADFIIPDKYAFLSGKSYLNCKDTSGHFYYAYLFTKVSQDGYIDLGKFSSYDSTTDVFSTSEGQLVDGCKTDDKRRVALVTIVCDSNAVETCTVKEPITCKYEMTITVKQCAANPTNAPTYKSTVTSTLAPAPVSSDSTKAASAKPISIPAPVIVSFKMVLAMAGISCSVVGNDINAQKALVATLKAKFGASAPKGINIESITVAYGACSRRRLLADGAPKDLAADPSVNLDISYPTMSTDAVTEAKTAQQTVTNLVKDPAFVTDLKAKAKELGSTSNLDNVQISSVSAGDPTITTFGPTLNPTRNPASGDVGIVKGQLVSAILIVVVGLLHFF